MENMLIGKRIVETFFSGISVIDLWKSCPCQMLWEAINKANSTIISQYDVLQQLRRFSSVYILPELLPAIYLGIEPAYKLVKCSSFPEDNESLFGNATLGEWNLLDVEPLYIVSCDFSWMIVLTTENTPSGERLCAYMEGDLSEP